MHCCIKQSITHYKKKIFSPEWQCSVAEVQGRIFSGAQMFHRYQAAHLKTRNSVERAIGIWKRHFPCLDIQLQHKPERSIIIITACVALHNLARQRNEPCPAALAAPPVPPRHRGQQQSHVPPAPPDPVDTVNGSRSQARLIARCFQ